MIHQLLSAVRIPPNRSEIAPALRKNLYNIESLCLWEIIHNKLSLGRIGVYCTTETALIRFNKKFPQSPANIGLLIIRSCVSQNLSNTTCPVVWRFGLCCAYKSGESHGSRLIYPKIYYTNK